MCKDANLGIQTSSAKNNLLQDKAKPFVKRGRKATGLTETAGLPRGPTERWVTLERGWFGFFCL